MEWKRFELLCAEYFRCLGKRVETVTQGADGGIDARIFSDKRIPWNMLSNANLGIAWLVLNLYEYSMVS